MRTIRGRLILAYAVALGVTLLVFAALLLSSSRSAAQRMMQARVDGTVDLGASIIAQAGTALFDRGIVVADEQASLPPLSASVASRLARLPGLVLLVDSSRVLFANAPALQLGARDQDKVLRAVRRSFSAAQPAGFVALDSVPFRLYVQVHVERPDARSQPLRLAAATSVEELAFFNLPIFPTIAVSFPLIFVLSVLAAWGLAGTYLKPVDDLIADLEAIQDGRSLHRRLPVESDENELDRLAETVNRMLARLEGSFAALRRFTADASHELKTPLTVIRADLERAMSTPAVSAELLPPLEEALAESARMADLVDSLLTLARADEGRFDLHREPVDLQELAREVFETALILGEPTEVQVSMEADLPAVVLGDRMRLRQLFMNLVENAIKYTPRGGSVELSLKVEEGLAAFAVKDSGIGIAAADLPHIFERFWRADRARTRMSERSGNGLGLAICQWIAQAHGGKLTVQSRLHRGSTFVASFPLAPTISMQAQAPTLAEEAATA